MIAEVMVMTVGLSILLHGISFVPLASWYGRRQAADPSSSTPSPAITPDKL